MLFSILLFDSLAKRRVVLQHVLDIGWLIERPHAVEVTVLAVAQLTVILEHVRGPRVR